MVNDPSRFAGILYPDVLQVDELILPMLDSMKGGLVAKKDIYTYKQLRIGSVGAKIAFNETKTIFAVFDGFIENEEELAKFGIPQNRQAPAATLISAYEIWKEECLEHLDGDFAFALYDTVEGQLLLARDRIGKKPLYWYHDAHYFIFASELKALLATGLVPQTPALDAIAMYFYFGFIPQDLSPIKGVSKLLPAHSLIFHRHKGCSIRPYWSYSSFFETHPVDIKATEQIQKKLEVATKRLLPESPEPLGCFITGGIGSATVAWSVCNNVSNNINAYTAVFSQQTEEDGLVASEVASTLKMPLKEYRIKPDTLTESLIEIVWSLDEPLADPTITATWAMSALAAKDCKIVFSGMGSDEFLAGHNRYTKAEQAVGILHRLNLIPRPILQKMIIPFIHKISPKTAYHLLKASKTNSWQFEFLRHNAVFNESELQAASPKLAKLLDPETFLHKFHHMPRIPSSVSQLLYFDVKTRLPDHFMLQYERLTKAHGLSWRSPFLNRDLIEYTASLREPEVLEENETASYLKPLIRPIFSDRVVGRPKKVRHSFLNPWSARPEIHSLFQHLLKGTLIETGIISEAWLREQLYSHGETEENFRALWSILILEVWFRLFINHPVRSAPHTNRLHELLSET